MKKSKRSDWNWIAFLEKAIKKEPSIKEYAAARRKAGSWPTCACGQLCKRLPRDKYDGSPKDLIACALGVSFYKFVRHRKWFSALEVLHFIEARTAILLNQQVKQSTKHPK